MLDGRFEFGIGTGENLNEHIFGDRWPPTDVRLEMLEEAVEVMRLLWEGGTKTHYGKHYTVENACVYTLPDEPPPVLVSGFGPKATQLAAKIGDGYMMVAPEPDLLEMFRSSGGGDKPAHGAFKVCYGDDEAERRKTAHRIWPNEALSGELPQELRTVAHFEQATQLVTEDMVAEVIPSGPDLEPHKEMLRQYADAGYDEVYVQQIGGNFEEFFQAYRKEILPEFG